MKRNAYHPTPLAVAVLAAIAATAASAQEFMDLETAVTPQSTVRAGLGYLSDDNRWYGQYQGFQDSGAKGAQLILDLDAVNRDDEQGSWMRFGADTNGGYVDFSRQGDWGVEVDYLRTNFRNPKVFNTTLDGIGTGTQTLATSTLAPRDVDLEMERNDFKVGVEKYLGDVLKANVSFRQESKMGARQFGLGTTHSFMSEPIDYETREVEASLGYVGDTTQITFGYYGSTFENPIKVLATDLAPITGETTDHTYLPLDNQMHQVYLSGAMKLASTTRVNFKVSKSRATQDDTFPADPAFVNVSRTNADAEVETTLAYASLTSRPLPELSVNASVRYEDRDDKTPVDQYFGTAPLGMNVPHQREFTHWKLGANYRLPMGFTLTGGFEQEDRKRSAPEIRQLSFRRETNEDTWRIGVRRSLSATLNGSVSYSHGERDGSDYLEANSNAAADLVGSLHFKDRERDKWRLQLDWMPLDPLSLQLVYELTDDSYSGREHGPLDGESSLVALDAAYRVNDEWTVTGWVSRDEIQTRQRTNGDSADNSLRDVDWIADLSHQGDALGIGLRGMVMHQHRVGADLQYGRDTSRHGIDVTGSAADDDLADIEYKYLRLNLFGQYVLDENSGFRLDYVYEKRDTNDWSWVGWTYSDGTTVRLEDDEDIHFIGVSYYKKWR